MARKSSYIAGPGQVQIKPPDAPQYNVNQQAERDVSLANQPVLQEIAGQANQVRDTYGEMDVGARNIHGMLSNELNALPGVGQQYQDTARGLNKNLGGLAKQMGDFGMGPQWEAQADAGAFAAQGEGAQTLLAGQMARSQDWTRGVKAQTGVDLANRRANYLETMRDSIEKLQQQRMGVFSGMDDQLKQRQNELTDQRFQQGLGLWETGLQAEQQVNDNELRDALINMINKQNGKKDKGKKGDGYGGSPKDLDNQTALPGGQGPKPVQPPSGGNKSGKKRRKPKNTGGTGSGPKGQGPKGQSKRKSKRGGRG